MIDIEAARKAQTVPVNKPRYTQKELATKLGITVPTYLNWCRNPKSIPAWKLPEIADLLEVEVQELFF